MMYFTYVHNYYSAKNKLEKAVQEFLMAEARKVIPIASLNAYKESVTGSITGLMEQHPKCSPIKIEWKITKSNFYGRDSRHIDYKLSLNNNSIINFGLLEGSKEVVV